MKAGLAPGATGEVILRVEGPAMTIQLEGAGAPAVYATPRLVWDMESAAREALRPFLEPGEETVGTRIEVRHLAATPVGMRVRATARVTEVDGRRVVFAVEAHDETEKIGEGTHERFVIQVAKFASRVAAKKPGGAR
jgi:predicted thioesterase